MPVKPLPIAAVLDGMAQEVGASSAFILRLCPQDAATSVSLAFLSALLMVKHLFLAISDCSASGKLGFPEGLLCCY